MSWLPEQPAVPPPRGGDLPGEASRSHAPRSAYRSSGPRTAGQPSASTESPSPEDNPFLATEDEKLSVSERKAEVDAEEVIFHDPIGGGTISKDKKEGKDKKKDTSDEEELSDEQRLKMLEDRLLSGQLSEEIYKKLRSKYTVKLLKSLEDQLLKGDITENEYNEKKEDLE